MNRSCLSAWLSLALIFTASALPAWADGPRLESPADAATDVGMYPNLLWEGGVAGIDPQLAHYRVQIAENQNFDPVLVDDTVEIARYVPAKRRLAPGSSFHWRVQRVDTQGQAGPWSESRRATVADFLGPQNENVIEVFAADSVDQVRQKFAQAKKMPAATVRLMEDVRWGDPTQEDLFNLKGHQNLWFDGNGKSIVITHPAQRVFHVLESRNVVISDFELDFDPLPYGVVEVTELRPEANELVVSAITEGEAGLAFDDPRMIAAPREHMRQVDMDHPGRVAYGGQTYIHDGSRQKLNLHRSYSRDGRRYHIIELNPDAIRTDAFALGDRLFRVARAGAHNTLRTSGSDDVCVDNLTVHSSTSQFVSFIMGSAPILINSTVAPKPGRYQSVTADCVYGRANRIGPWVQYTSFTAGGDDTMNFHGIAGGVVAKIDDRTLAVEPPEFHGVDPGDRVVIWDANPGTQPPVHTTVIAKDRKTMQLTFADDVGPIETISEGKPRWTTGIYNADRGNQRFYVADCTMRDSARFGNLLSSQDGALVDNTYDHCAMSAVKIGTDPWEGLLNRNLLIKDNTMINCGYTSDYFESNDGVITVASYGAPHWTPVDQRFQSSLLFENNTIHGWESAAFYLHGCEDVQITGTHLTDGGNAAFSPLAKQNTVLITQNCRDISLRDTTVEDSRPTAEIYRDLGNSQSVDLGDLEEAF